jgi:hypothetical protein
MIQMRNESRAYTVESTGAVADRTGRRTQRTIVTVCPFCSERVTIYAWSLCGNGKLCKCGAKFQSGGKAWKLIELANEPQPTDRRRS